ncbi:hypothetical protein M2302_001053 [Micromonospora sp. A200]|uniref:hypothetical protein n=1 Tax=Micromonospora sp. A200 TaxID=2940568 RepID=UPI00247507C1|nr:hypothetical protein [Micromonospora sp. A200]MDH6460887.1 hypothetical protein [Micromonospora sp. A200]
MTATAGDELLYRVAEQSAWLRRVLRTVGNPDLTAVVEPILDRIDTAITDGQLNPTAIAQVYADLAYVHALLAGGVIE